MDWTRIIVALVCMVIVFIVIVYWMRRAAKFQKQYNELKKFIDSSEVGTLRVETSDPDGPFLFLEMEISPEELMTKDRVVLNVNTKSYFSQN